MMIENENREKGLTLPELLVWLGVFATVGTFVAIQGAGILSGTKTEQANQEVQSLVLAARNWRSVKGNYTDIQIKGLKDNGYNINFPLDSDDGINVYDEKVSITSSAPQTAEVKYITTATSECNQLKDRVENIPGIENPVCDAGTFELKFEI